jgi:hypothetical protein
MKRTAMASVAVTIGCLAGIGASSAVALPELGRCVSQAGAGKYKNASCTEKAGSKTGEK